MGKAKAWLETELPLERAVKDLAQCWQDTEADVLNVLADVYYDGTLALHTKVSVPVPGCYVKQMNPATGKQITTKKLAKAPRTITLQGGSAETRLRHAARDGLSNVPAYETDGHSIELRSMFVGKDSLINALKSKHLSIPPKWIDGHDAGNLPLELSKRPLPQQRYQEQEILRALREAGYDPKALPTLVQRNSGRPGMNAGAKAAARARLSFTPSVFNKAWERLRQSGDIQDAK